MTRLRSRHLVFLAALSAGCSRPAEPPADAAAAVVLRFEGGTVTEAELETELQQMPPYLRERFAAGAGRRELARTLGDRKLLALEARKQGFTEDPEVKRQVRELEERLSIQALLKREEQSSQPTEADARAYHAAHTDEFAEAPRVRVVRVLARAAAATPAAKANARARAEALRKRLLAKESAATVAQAGEGPERTQGGDLGLKARGEFDSREEESVAFALARPGDVSAVVETERGAAVLVLVERRAARVPTFEEVKQQVMGRLGPSHQREVLRRVLERLRREAGVTAVGASAAAGQ